MNDGGVYRVQIGSFLGPNLARECFDRLAAAGLNPRFELFGDKYRVVIPGVAAAEIPAVARRLGDAGFPEAWIRRESD
jgi:cell division protein FtsN